MTSAFVRAASSAWLIAVFAAPADAHESRPALLDISEMGHGRHAIVWKVPVRDGYAPPIMPRFPEGCSLMKGVEYRFPEAQVMYATVQCPNESLAGEKVVVEGLENTILETFVLYKDRHGNEASLLLSGRQSSGQLILEESATRTVQPYFRLGIEHIFTGYDHLLFVLGLLFLVSGWRKLILTVSGFTFAHATTLGSSTYGLTPAGSSTIETLIALSVLMLAVEAARNHFGQTSVASKHPIAIAIFFGLLHGFGFAGALAETGLPEEHALAALLFFNLGIEAGQLLFIMGALLCGRMISAMAPAAKAPLRLSTTYLIGSFAAYWTLDRATGLIATSI